MAQQTVGVGTTANDGTGDAPRTAGQKINSNFDELYAAIASLTSSLAGKANTSHTHLVANLSDATADAKALLQTYDNTDFASSAHTHELSDVDELVDALASKYDSSHVGTTANKLVQLTSAAKLPAVDGSLLKRIAYQLLVLNEPLAPTGNTVEQAATWDSPWQESWSSGPATSTNCPHIRSRGWNTWGTVAGEPRFYETIESYYDTGGCFVSEWHIEGVTKPSGAFPSGQTWRCDTATYPREALADASNGADESSGRVFRYQRFEVAPLAETDGTISTDDAFRFDFRGGVKNLDCFAGANVRFVEVDRAQIYQRLNDGTTYQALPWVDGLGHTQVTGDTYVAGLCSATGIINSPVEFRLGNTFSRVADADGSGGFVSGFNVKYDGGVKRDSDGPASAIHFMPDGILNFYAIATGTAGDSLTRNGYLHPTLGLQFTGLVNATTEFRLGNTFSRVAQSDGAGGFGGGYNVKMNSTSVVSDQGGGSAGFYVRETGYSIYTGSPAANAALNEVFRADDSSTANDMRLMLWDVTAGTLVRVSRGASDSGGAGFRVLRIPN